MAIELRSQGAGGRSQESFSHGSSVSEGFSPDASSLPLKVPTCSFSIGCMIKFLCPNGHPLSAPENLAGKPGKCPKCNTPFVVPPPDDAEGSATDDLAAAGSGIATPAMGSGKGLGGGTFMFLCPNGHRLNGPPSLKGKAGQCPHCGVRFRIPTDDELD